MSVNPATDTRTHLDINDRDARSAFASRLGIDESRLRKAARLVGTRISSLTAYLSK